MKFEYMIYEPLYHHSEPEYLRRLNELGGEGWEIAALNKSAISGRADTLIMKREQPASTSRNRKK